VKRDWPRLLFLALHFLPCRPAPSMRNEAACPPGSLPDSEWCQACLASLLVPCDRGSLFGWERCCSQALSACLRRTADLDLGSRDAHSDCATPAHRHHLPRLRTRALSPLLVWQAQTLAALSHPPIFAPGPYGPLTKYILGLMAPKFDNSKLKSRIEFKKLYPEILGLNSFAIE